MHLKLHEEEKLTLIEEDATATNQENY